MKKSLTKLILLILLKQFSLDLSCPIRTYKIHQLWLSCRLRCILALFRIVLYFCCQRPIDSSLCCPYCLGHLSRNPTIRYWSCFIWIFHQVLFLLFLHFYSFIRYPSYFIFKPLLCEVQNSFSVLALFFLFLSPNSVLYCSVILKHFISKEC